MIIGEVVRLKDGGSVLRRRSSRLEDTAAFLFPRISNDASFTVILSEAPAQKIGGSASLLGGKDLSLQDSSARGGRVGLFTRQSFGRVASE